jgi:hypothetical protein
LLGFIKLPKRLKKMTIPAENYDDSIKSQTPDASVARVVSLGVTGIVIGAGGYLAVMLLSKESGWWSAPYIASLLTCGIVAVTLGAMATNKSGRLPNQKILARIVGIISMVMGVLITGLVGFALLLMLMLSSFRW